MYLHIWRRLNAIADRIGNVLRTQHGKCFRIGKLEAIEDFSIHGTRTNALRAKNWVLYGVLSSVSLSFTYCNLCIAALEKEFLTQHLSESGDRMLGR